jgi:hypothetical protein
MADLQNHRRAVERILEDESLTADLTDVAAQFLLDWGLVQAETMVRQAEGLLGEEIDTHLTALRRTMKRIGKQAGKSAPEAQVERVQALLTEIEIGKNLEVKTENDA